MGKKTPRPSSASSTRSTEPEPKKQKRRASTQDDVLNRIANTYNITFSCNNEIKSNNFGNILRVVTRDPENLWIDTSAMLASEGYNNEQVPELSQRVLNTNKPR